jgi:hypothetical protein
LPSTLVAGSLDQLYQHATYPPILAVQQELLLLGARHFLQEVL